MKKLIACMLTLSVMLSLCACCCIPVSDGGGNSGNNSYNVPDVPVVADPTEPEKEFSLGVIDGNYYENSFLGIGCVLDDYWLYYTDEQIREMNGFVMDVAGEDFQNAVKNADLYYDMAAIHPNGMNSVNVVFEKISNVQLEGLDLTQNLVQSVPLLKSTLENMGYVIGDYSTYSVYIGGEEFPCMTMEADIYGMPCWFTSIPVKCNGYLATISISVFESDTTLEVLDFFYLVD